MCATDRPHPCFRKSEVLHLALLNQLFHRSRNVFDRHVGIYAVLIEQVDDIGLEALERCLGDLLDVFWTTVQATPTRSTIGIRLPPELGGDHHLVTNGSQRLAHEFFVWERAIDLSRIEERYDPIYGRPEKA